MSVHMSVQLSVSLFTIFVFLLISSLEAQRVAMHLFSDTLWRVKFFKDNFCNHSARGYLSNWGSPNVFLLALSLQYTTILYIQVLVLKYTTVNISGLAERLPPNSFDVKNFIQQHDNNGPTSDAIFIIKTMVPDLVTIVHPFCTLFKLYVSFWR